MDFVSRLREKVAQFTARPRGDEPSSAQETIVLGQFGDPLDEAFRIARGLIDSGRAVRIIAPGVTLRRVWPTWVYAARQLTLTEWGAFWVTSEREATEGLQSEVRDWIHNVFEGDFGGQPPERIFFAAASQRFCRSLIAAYPVARAIARTFPGASIHCVRPNAFTGALLQQFLAASGGRVVGQVSTRRAPLPTGALILGLGMAAATAFVVRLAKDYISAVPTIRELRARRQSSTMDTPETWVGVYPDWYRMNYHLLDAFALPEIERGGSLGVLFIGTLAPYMRDEQNMRRHHRSDLWPGLGKLRGRLSQCMVEQAVMPEEPLALARAILVGLGRSTRLLLRLASSPEVKLPSARFSPPIKDLAVWASADVLRATFGEAAVKTLLARVPMKRTTVIFVGSNNVAWAPVDRALRDAGATTVDHPHGAASDWSAIFDSESSLRLLWIYPDVTSAASPDMPTLVTGMPIRMRLPPRSQRPRRFLVMTSYVHRDSSMNSGFPGAKNPFPLRIFQDELLGLIRLLRAHGHPDAEFRWRPHPSDNEALVREARPPNVQLSRGTPLEEDAEWADVIVSSLSTVVVECMFAGTPVFVHLLPEQCGIPATSFLASERIFYHAEDGARRIVQWVDRHGSDPATGLDAEQRARVILFGEHGVPVPMTSYFGCKRSTMADSTAHGFVR